MYIYIHAYVDMNIYIHEYVWIRLTIRSHCKVRDTISFVVITDSGIRSSCLQFPWAEKDALLFLLALGTKE